MIRLRIPFHGEGNRGVKENKVFSLGSYDGETMGELILERRWE